MTTEQLLVLFANRYLLGRQTALYPIIDLLNEMGRKEQADALYYARVPDDVENGIRALLAEFE